MRFQFGDHVWDLPAGCPRIVGILNVTPDSFSDGGLHSTTDAAVRRGIEMAAEGADLLEVGGESTRPGSEPVSEEDELNRVLPVVAELSRQVRTPISIDTSKASVAARAIQAGATIVNDVTAAQGDPRMASVAAEAGAGIVLMHMRGVPRTMQSVPPHYADVVAEVREFLGERIRAVADGGVPTDCIAVDPGIGFGKDLEHNLALLRSLEAFESLGRPVMVGTSRKSFIGRITGQDTPSDRVEGTIASCLSAARHGARFLRVHDVAQVRRALSVWQAIEVPGRGAIAT